MKNNKTKVLRLISVLIILYAVGLKFAPEYMPFSKQSNVDDFYAPHAGQCVPDLVF